MSEFEQNALDQEIMEMANQGCGKPVAPVADEQLCDCQKPEEKSCFWASVAESIEKEKAEQEEREIAAHKKWVRRCLIKTVTWVTVCAVAVAALITMLYVPAAMPWVVNLGTLCFVVAASIMIDRAVRRWHV